MAAKLPYVTKAPYLSVKNYQRYQHYRDRNPPWVKLYWDLLSDEDFVQLGLVDRGLLCQFFLVASRHNNRIPNDLRYIKLQMKIDDEPDLSNLFRRGWLIAWRKQKDSKTPAPSALPSTEIRDQRTEREREEEKIPPAAKTKRAKVPIPEGYVFSPEVRAWAQKKYRLPDGVLDDEQEACRDHHTKLNTLFKDWDAAGRTWIREYVRRNPTHPKMPVVRPVQAEPKREPPDPATMERLRNSKFGKFLPLEEPSV